MKAKQRKPSKMKKAQIMLASFTITGIILVGGILLFVTFGPKQEAFADVTVYKSPTCGCCTAWVNHLEENGFDVEVVDHDNVVSFKRKYGVPERHYSCHTAVVNDYIIEGHVPAIDIRKLISEKSKAKGLTVPGMPHGSPGMETGRVDHYKVFAFDENKNTRIFNRY